MNIASFITLLTVFSTATSLCTEACKKMLDEIKVSYASNILAFIIASIVGICGTAIYYILASIDFNAINITCMILMGLVTAVAATVGYDKVMQTISQLKNKI